MRFWTKTVGSFLLVVPLVLCVAVSVSLAQVITPELRTKLQLLSPQDEVPVIIRLSEKADLTQIKLKNRHLRRSRVVRALRNKAELTQYPLRRFLEGIAGLKNMRQLWIINGMALSLRPNVIRQLEGWPGIERITLDGKISAPSIVSSPPAEPEWNLYAIRAPELWDRGHMGRGVVIATMDSGIDIHHPDLCQKWRGGSNSWFDPYLHTDTPYDSLGHGTAVLGAIVGGAYGGTHIGVAPYAQWISVKIWPNVGDADLSLIHWGFQRLLDPDDDPDTDDAPDVVNNSWSLRNTNECDLEFHEDIHVLKEAGIAVVFAAGNYTSGTAPPSSSVSPANNPEGFATGGVDDVDGELVVVYDSRRGPSPCDEDGSVYPEIVAPGDHIKTTDRTSDGLHPDSYSIVGGTSIAASHVSGAMALLIGAFPDVTVQELEEALKDSAFDLGDLGPDNDYGYGLIDVMAAYEILLESHTPNAADLVSIPYVQYNPFENSLWVEATTVPSEGTIVPEETYVLNASVESFCNILDSGAMAYDAEGDSYTREFNDIASQPGSVVVTSSGGGASTFYLDKVTILSTVYRADTNTLTVNATTNRTGGTESLTASVISGGTVVNSGTWLMTREGILITMSSSISGRSPTVWL